jgi:hypothetical protein
MLLALKSYALYHQKLCSLRLKAMLFTVKSYAPYKCLIICLFHARMIIRQTECPDDIVSILPFRTGNIVFLSKNIVISSLFTIFLTTFVGQFATCND